MVQKSTNIYNIYVYTTCMTVAYRGETYLFKLKEV